MLLDGTPEILHNDFFQTRKGCEEDVAMETKSQLTTPIATKSCPSAPEAKGLLNRGAEQNDDALRLQVRDRIRELRRVRARELLPNRKNWRRHPKAQAEALRGLLAEVGYADALLVRELPDGRLVLIDGHLRAETTPDSEVPVLVLDVTAEEADKIL